MNSVRSIFALPPARRFTVRARRSRASNRRGFTLIEVLATLLLIGIALPVIMRGFSLSNTAAFMARQRSEAGALAESKVNELVGTSIWQNGAQSGGFDGHPEYQWSAQLAAWGTGQGVNGTNLVQELDVTVTWGHGNSAQSITVSTLVYQSANATGTGIQGGLP